MNQFGVVLFHTTSAALRTEKALLSGGHAIKLIPTPRQFSSDCGIAIRFDWTRMSAVRQVLADAHIETAGIHPLD